MFIIDTGFTFLLHKLALSGGTR